MSAFIVFFVVLLALLIADAFSFGVVMHRWLTRNGGNLAITQWLDSRERTIAKLPMGSLYLLLRGMP